MDKSAGSPGENVPLAALNGQKRWQLRWNCPISGSNWTKAPAAAEELSR